MKRWWLLVALASSIVFALTLALHQTGANEFPVGWSWRLEGARSALVHAALSTLTVLVAAVCLIILSPSGKARTDPSVRELGERLVQQSRDAVIRTDPHGNIIFWNPGAERLFGHTREQTLGMSILSLFPDDSRAAAADLLRTRAAGAPQEIETQALHRSGQCFDIRLSVSAHDGTPDGQDLIWYGMDISARKQLERTVRQVLDAGYGHSASQFLHFLTEQLAATLGTRYAFISEFDDDGKTARIISFWNRDHLDEAFEYALADTPCEELRVRDLVCYADRAMERFPRDRFLQRYDVHAYLAIALFDGHGKPLGHMGLMDSKALTNVEYCTTVLRIFSSRAAAELQRVRADQSIAHRLAMEELLAALSSSFVGVEAADFDQKVDAALQRLGLFAGVDRCHLYRFSQDQSRAVLTHLWSAASADSLPDSYREIPSSAFPWHSQQLHARGFVLIPDANDLPPEAGAEKSELHRGNVRSMLNVGMYGGGRLIGFLGFESLQRAIRWPPEDLRLLRVVGEVLVNADERQQREQTLRTLSSALDQTADAIVITDREGTIEYVNPAFVQISGYDRTEALGRQPSMLRSDAHDAAFYQDMWLTILRGDVYRGTVVNRRKDGSLYHEEKTITPLKDPRGVITHFISTGRDISERVHAQERLLHLAHHDALTDLPNRNLFMDRAQQAIARARRSGNQVAVLFLDLDGFKEVNDSLGHDAGDALLCLVADRLRAGVRQGDTVSRLGGDEFTILIEDIAGPNDAAAVAKKLAENLARPFSIGGAVRRVSASVGISIYPNDGQEPETLLTKADKAMFQAKRDAPPGSYRFA